MIMLMIMIFYVVKFSFIKNLFGLNVLKSFDKNKTILN
jgi:hypothetical protein